MMGGTDGDDRRQKLNMIGTYVLGKTIGEGSFAKVKAAFDERTGQRVAIKIIEKSRIADAKTMDRTLREIGVLKVVKHPNIIQLVEVIDTPERIHVVVEYVDGGELFDYIVAHQRVKENRAKRIFRGIVEAVEYCHSLNIIHRDLKPENILLDKQKNIKLIDFGLCNTLRRDYGLRSRCGSPYYVAPEMVSGKGYGTSVDVWSLGVILYSLLTGDVPFSDNNLTALLEKIVEGKYHIPRYLSEDAKDLIRNLLVTEPSKRFTINDIRRHPWIGAMGSPPEIPDINTSITLPLDDSVLRQMEEVGFESKLVYDYIRGRVKNGVTNMYRLLLSRKRSAESKAPFDRLFGEKDKEKDKSQDTNNRSFSIMNLRDMSVSANKLVVDPILLPPVLGNPVIRPNPNLNSSLVSNTAASALSSSANTAGNGGNGGVITINPNASINTSAIIGQNPNTSLFTNSSTNSTSGGLTAFSSLSAASSNPSSSAQGPNQISSDARYLAYIMNSRSDEPPQQSSNQTQSQSQAPVRTSTQTRPQSTHHVRPEPVYSQIFMDPVPERRSISISSSGNPDLRASLFRPSGLSVLGSNAPSAASNAPPPFSALFSTVSPPPPSAIMPNPTHSSGLFGSMIPPLTAPNPIPSPVTTSMPAPNISQSANASGAQPQLQTTFILSSQTGNAGASLLGNGQNVANMGAQSNPSSALTFGSSSNSAAESSSHSQASRKSIEAHVSSMVS